MILKQIHVLLQDTLDKRHQLVSQCALILFTLHMRSRRGSQSSCKCTPSLVLQILTVDSPTTISTSWTPKYLFLQPPLAVIPSVLTLILWVRYAPKHWHYLVEKNWRKILSCDFMYHQQEKHVNSISSSGTPLQHL